MWLWAVGPLPPRAWAWERSFTKRTGSPPFRGDGAQCAVPEHTGWRGGGHSGDCAGPTAHSPERILHLRAQRKELRDSAFLSVIQKMRAASPTNLC